MDTSYQPWISAAIATLPGFGDATVRRMLELNHNVDLLSLSATTLESVLSPSQLRSWSTDTIRTRAAQLHKDAQRWKITCIDLRHPSYPTLLREAKHVQPVLFFRGDIQLFQNKSITIVGTRKPTSYGIRHTRRIATHASERGLTIVSGMAYGVDGLAHRTAIDANGPTIAVLGCGLDDPNLYPAGHQALAREILRSGGLLCSPFPAGTKAELHHFPLRNQLLAALSPATIVTECKAKSGAMITARLALDYNRDVYTIPGDIDNPMSAGPHQLISEGAHLLLTPDDALNSYDTDTQSSAESSITNLHPTLSPYSDMLRQNPSTLEQLQRAFPTIDLLPILTEMELLGIVELVHGRYQLIS